MDGEDGGRRTERMKVEDEDKDGMEDGEGGDKNREDGGQRTERMEERTRLERTRIEQRRRMEEDGEDGGVRGWRGGGQGWVMEKEEYEV